MILPWTTDVQYKNKYMEVVTKYPYDISKYHRTVYDVSNYNAQQVETNLNFMRISFATPTQGPGPAPDPNYLFQLTGKLKWQSFISIFSIIHNSFKDHL